MAGDVMSITPKKLADKHLGEYKKRNGNIVSKYCPFCKGGQNNDKYTFGISIDNGAYNCFRGKCGAKGSFYELCQHFNEYYEFDDDKYNKSNYTHKKKNYTKPDVETNNVNGKVKKYLKKRGFSNKTINYCDIKEKDGNIAFEYYQDKQLVLVKYRNLKKGDKKQYWQEGGG